MTDTSVNSANPIGTAQSLSDSLSSALRAAPELGQSPGTAVSAATSADPVGNAQAIARGTQAMTTAQAGNRVAKSAGSGGGVFGWFGHVASSALGDVAQAPADIGNAAMKGLEDVGTVLNKPLSTVQHEYRYLHDVEARHGQTAALLEGLGLAAGAAVGFAAGGVSGAVLGADAAGYLEGQSGAVLGNNANYHDSWTRTANGNTYRDPNTGQAVSIGRDIASVVPGAKTGVTHSVLSGVIDGFFDMTADPLAEGGSLAAKARSAEGAPGLLGHLFEGTGIHAGSAAPEDVQRIFDNPLYTGVRRAADQMANMTSGEIAARYPAFDPIADRLGAATTRDEVQHVFEQAFRANELMTTDRLPSMSFTHLALQKTRYALANTPQIGDTIARIAPNSQRLINLGGAAEHIVGPQTLMRRFERTPVTYNPDMDEFSSRAIPLNSNLGAHALYSLVREGETPHVAEDVVTQFLSTSNPGERRQIFRTGLLNALAARAHLKPADFGEFANEDTLSAFKEQLDALTGGANPGVNEKYGNAMDGRDLSPVETADGAHHAAAILPSQTADYVSIPSARDFRDASQILKGARDTWGKIDSFAYEHATQSVFKRLVLLSLSYAEHITGAEVVPNVLRNGLFDTVKSGLQLNRALGHMGADNTEIGLIRNKVFKLLRMDRGETPDDEDVKLAARWIQLNGGLAVNPSVDTGHAISNETKEVDRAEHGFRAVFANAPRVLRPSRDFLEVGREEENFTDTWQKVLNEMSLNKSNEVVRVGARALYDMALNASHLPDDALYANGAMGASDLRDAETVAVAQMTNYINEQSDAWRGNVERMFLHSPGAPETMGFDEDWARVMLAHLKGATFSPDGAPHIPLLYRIARGEVVPVSDLDDVPLEKRPLVIKGREMVPSGEGALNRVTNAIANPIFTKMLNPFVNMMSREPLAFQEFKRQWALVKDADNMTEDEKMVLARARTATRSVRFVHNLNDRTQWTDTMRNWAPFYFAQEQAYRRMGRLLAENPGAFRRYQMMISALQNFSVRQQASNGTEYVVLPGTGFLTSGVVNALAKIPGIGKEIQSAAPVGMGWDVGAASVIFPLSNGFRPDVGPVAALPAEAISNLFPEQASPSVKADLVGISTAIGGPTASEPVWEQLIPNTIVQRLAVAATANSSTFDSAFISTMQSMEYHHELPPEGAGPVAMQNFLNKVQNQTRILFVMKALVGAVTPVSPELQAQDYNFPSELQADITKTGSAILGTQEFLKNHPDAAPWTIFRSHSTTGLSPLSTEPAENWINSNMGLIQKYGYAALYFMPQIKNGAYSSEVYNAQIAQNLRTKFAPQEYLNQLYKMGANDTYYTNYDTFQSYVQKNGLTGTQLYDAEQNFINWEAGFAAQHPIWAQQYYTPGDFASDRTTSTDRIEAITQMRQMIARNEAPAGSMTDGIKTLLDGYANYTNAIAVGKTDNYTAAENAQTTQNWQNYLTTTAKQEPELATVINSVFMYAPKGGVGSNG